MRPQPLLNLIFILTCVLAISACAARPVAVREEWSPGVVRRAGTLVTGKQEGEWTFHDRAGRIEARGGFSHDLQEGTWTWFHSDGTLRLRGAYQAGLRTGAWLQQDAAGRSEAVGGYDRDRSDGFWRYAAGGQASACGWYEFGVRHGAWLTYGVRGLASAGPRWRGLAVGPQLAADGVVTDAGVPLGYAADRVDRGAVTVWRLRDGVGTEVLLWVHAAGRPRLLQARLSGDEVLARWDDTGRLLVAGRRTHAGPIGAWVLGHGDTEVSMAASPRTAAVATPDLVSESLAQADAVQVASAAFDAEVRTLTAPLPPPAPAVVTISSEVPTSMTVLAGTPTPAVLPAALAQVDPVPAPATAPVALLPDFFTTAQQAKSMDLVQRYAQSRATVDEYGRTSGQKHTNRADLLGKALPQTRFLGSDGRVLDLTTWQGKPAVVLVMRGFSGQVCLYCAAQTAAVAGRIADFRSAGTEVLVIYPGPAESITAFVAAVQTLRQEPAPLAIALDPALLMVRSLGIEGNLARPTALVLDAKGVVTFAYAGTTIADRPTVDDLLREVGRATR